MAEEKTSTKSQEPDLLKELLDEGLAIQHRFAAEPVFAKTGKGHLKSEGVTELAKLRKQLKSSNGSD